MPPASTRSLNSDRFQALEIKELSHRLAAQTYRFLQPHPRVEHWLSLEELRRRTPLDPLLNLLTLPIRPDLDAVVLSMPI
ncbi:hypothetical protein [Synechococcus sp. HK01-R]|uniref:hypothetical protein n=1 Tax=Synechococcus sp. HK01-R TaxID=2751171 RepID=UPI00162ABE81|nr:hypothetical protein [Synechococcus sp. HK01-R]QNG27863.1 hypothetical protein H0O21_04590 [Synechococcus sp. HK01-R]